MFKKNLILFLIMSLVLIVLIYYKYATSEIPKVIAKSDTTMQQTNTIRFTFKVSILLQKSYIALTLAVLNQDEDKLQDAKDYFEAANGFLDTSFLNNKALVKTIEPKLTKISSYINTQGLSLTKKQLNDLSEILQTLLKDLERQEKDIWISFQHQYIAFQTNNYIIQNLSQAITAFSVLLLLLFLWILKRQQAYNKTIKQHQDELTQLAYYDVLTKIPNRQTIENIIREKIAYSKRKDSNFYLALIDIDNFKNVNDLHGHDIGDAVLIECAKRLKNSLRSVDALGRFGGDEFVIIFNDISTLKDLTTILNRILQSFKTPIQINTLKYYTNVSIGLSNYPLQAKDASELVKYADIAMYRSKELGKARYSFFDSSQSDIIKRQYTLGTQIETALKEREFELYYQPQLDAITQEIIGVEALVRWHHPTKGLLYPIEFIDIIEDGYLVREFGLWVITQAAKQQKIWQEEGINITMSVNVSVKHILSQNFYQEITSLVEELNIDLTMFNFEITEYNIMNHVEQSSEILNKLTQEGFIFSLDDFGTGYSSITHLYNLHIHHIKIDKIFIDMIVDESSKSPLIEAIVNMAKALNIKIIAEGVETQVQYNYLKSLYCDSIQGYYFSKPLSEKDFHAYFFSRLSLINTVSVHD